MLSVSNNEFNKEPYVGRVTALLESIIIRMLVLYFLIYNLEQKIHVKLLC